MDLDHYRIFVAPDLLAIVEDRTTEHWDLDIQRVTALAIPIDDPANDYQTIYFVDGYGWIDSTKDDPDDHLVVRVAANPVDIADIAHRHAAAIAGMGHLGTTEGCSPWIDPTIFDDLYPPEDSLPE